MRDGSPEVLGLDLMKKVSDLREFQGFEEVILSELLNVPKHLIPRYLESPLSTICDAFGLNHEKIKSLIEESLTYAKDIKCDLLPQDLSNASLYHLDNNKEITVQRVSFQPWRKESGEIPVKVWREASAILWYSSEDAKAFSAAMSCRMAGYENAYMLVSDFDKKA